MRAKIIKASVSAQIFLTYFLLSSSVVYAADPVIVTGTRSLLTAVSAIFTGIAALVTGVFVCKDGLQWMAAEDNHKGPAKSKIFKDLISGVIVTCGGGVATWVLAFYGG